MANAGGRSQAAHGLKDAPIIGERFTRWMDGGRKDGSTNVNSGVM